MKMLNIRSHDYSTMFVVYFLQGQLVTSRVMYHDVIMILLEVYDFNLASPGGPTRSIVLSALTFPSIIRSSAPKKDGL